MITNTRDPEDFEDIENHEASKDDIYNEAASLKKFDDMQKEIDEVIKQRDSKMNEFKTISSDVADISSKEKTGEATEEELKKQSHLHAKLNVLVKEIKEISNHINDLTKNIAFCVIESHTERNVSNMNEQITNILEAFKSGVLSTEEATAKLNVIQEAAIEESKHEDTSGNSNNEMFMTKQNHIMESYKLGIINSQEAIQLIERITMESEYMTEEDDIDDADDVNTADEGEGNEEPETTNSTEDISALAEYINSLDEETRAQLMGAINAPAEGANAEPTADDEGNVENVEEGSIPTNSDVSEPVEGPDTVREYANTSLNEMEV